MEQQLGPATARLDAASVLIVEGDAFLGTLLTNLLEINGLSVGWTSSVAEATEWMREQSPALLLVDADLQGHSGAEWVCQLREEAHPSQVPIVLLVAEGAPHRRIEGVSWFPKPVDAERLIGLVSALLLPHIRPLEHPSFGVEIGKDWCWGARSRHVVREFDERREAEAYLRRLSIPAGWCGALVEVESSPNMYLLGLRAVRTLLVRSGNTCAPVRKPPQA